MTPTIPQVEASRPEGLIRGGNELGRAANGLNDQMRAQRATLDTLRNGWQGPGSEAAIAKAVPTLEHMQRLHDAMTQLQGGLDSGGEALSTSRTQILQTTAQLVTQGWQVAPDGNLTVRPGSVLDQFAKAGASNAMRVRQLAFANSAVLKGMLAGFDAADRRLGQDVRSASGELHGRMQTWGGGAPVPQTPPDTGPRIPEGKDPVQVRDWWNSLTPEERARVIREQPEGLGNLNGVPVEARSQANGAVMERDVDRVEERAAVTGGTVDQVKADPEKFGLTSTDVTRYSNAVRVRDGLAANSDKTGGVPTFLYVYEPEAFDGQGRAAVAIGNPDDADDTAVVVPGTGNSVTSGWLSSGDAANVYNETFAADPSRTPSVVAWMGYDAPDSLVDPQVAQTGQARQGGGLLANDVNALEVTNRGDSHVTAIGHSYGSTTVADACAGSGMRADDVVLIGSPGTDLAEHASDFGLPPGGQVYVGAASTDPVTQLGGGTQVHVPGTDITVSLGADPANSDFGGTRFKAEVPGLTTPWGDHSQYLTLGNESLYAITDITSGHADLLDDHGMIAGERHTVPVWLPGVPGIEIDPEIIRPATSGHRH